jgi:hypothetical protein
MSEDKAKDSTATVNRELRIAATMVFNRMKLSPEERAAAWDSATSHPRHALTCFRAILNSYKSRRA